MTALQAARERLIEDVVKWMNSPMTAEAVRVLLRYRVDDVIQAVRAFADTEPF